MGEYIGSGDGQLSGQINGIIRWDLYEDRDDAVCLSNFAAHIETEDGVIIRFDARGHGKVPDPEKPKDRLMVYSMKFDTENERYHWLNATFAVWEAE